MSSGIFPEFHAINETHCVVDSRGSDDTNQPIIESIIINELEVYKFASSIRSEACLFVEMSIDSNNPI